MADKCKVKATDHFANAGKMANSPKPPDGWIKCSDRMPEHNVEVIFASEISVHAGHFDDGRYMKKPKGKWIWLGRVFTEEVIAWMPLPTPPANL